MSKMFYELLADTMKTVSPEERISLMYTAIASVTCKTTERERERSSPSFDIIHSKCVVIDLNKNKNKKKRTSYNQLMYFHTICKQTLGVFFLFFFLLKNIGVTVTLKNKTKSSGRHSSARVFSVYYTAKYIAQKCIVGMFG